MEVIFLFQGFDLELLIRLKNVLAVISCALKVRVEQFKKYCHETAELWAKTYKWYPMPTTVHIVLIHGWEIIQTMETPIGMLSEEALERTHKVAKSARTQHTSKISRYSSSKTTFSIYSILIIVNFFAERGQIWICSTFSCSPLILLLR